jgi:hypothetical protein
MEPEWAGMVQTLSLGGANHYHRVGTGDTSGF